MSTHIKPILQALFVTFLWSTSVILIKVGLESIPALTFAGLRYVIAFLVLLPLTWRVLRREGGLQLTRSDWWQMIGLGLLLYTFTQGAQFMALQYLPAATHSMILNGTSLVVLAIGMFWLSEYPTRLQMIGLLLFLAGLGFYFFPADFSQTQFLGLIVATFQVFSNAGAVTLGRWINRRALMPALLITTISMGIGSVVLLGSGLLIQGLPEFSLTTIAIILWLAVVNTAFTYTLWNHTQRSLSAIQSSMINSTMLIQIALLAWIFLGETPNPQEILGMIVAAIGILLVQLRRLTVFPGLARLKG